MPKETSPSARPSIGDAGAGLGRLAGAFIRNLIRHQSHESSVEADAFLAHLVEYEPLQQEALLIAARELLAGVETRVLQNGQRKSVLNAGMRNFREPWARDFGFASYGLLALGDLQTTRETLDAFFHYQKESGQFPVKVYSTNVLVRTLFSILNLTQPSHKPLRPKYISGHRSRSPDGNALLISAAVNYSREANDADYLRMYWPQLKKALRWLRGFAPDADGLISQGPFSDWADTIARTGKVLYTNIVYWKALLDVSAAARQFGFKVDRAVFHERANLLRQSIQDVFWRADLGYYVTSEEFDSLDTSGNLMAIAWSCASSAQSHAILDVIAEMGLSRPVPTRPVNVGYPRQRIALEARLGGFPHYHIDAAWLWIGAWHAIALTHMGRLEEASEILNRLAAVIVQDQTVHEVYESNGEPFQNIFYKSESPLTWSAGMIIYAFQRYHKRLHLAGEQGHRHRADNAVRGKKR